jgi:hypothetical protein
MSLSIIARRRRSTRYKEPADKLKLVKAEGIMDFIEEWPENLALFDGNNGCPLAHTFMMRWW